MAKTVYETEIRTGEIPNISGLEQKRQQGRGSEQDISFELLRSGHLTSQGHLLKRIYIYIYLKRI